MSPIRRFKTGIAAPTFSSLLRRRPDLFEAVIRGWPEVRLHTALRGQDPWFDAERRMALIERIRADTASFFSTATHVLAEEQSGPAALALLQLLSNTFTSAW